MHFYLCINIYNSNTMPNTKNIYHPDVYLAMAILCFCPPDI